MQLNALRHQRKNQTQPIRSLPGRFRKMEKALEHAIEGKTSDGEVLDTNLAEAEQVLNQDNLFKALVIQRSRAYVKESLSLDDKDEAPGPAPTARHLISAIRKPGWLRYIV